jgi:hypothetical protein
MVVLGIFFIDFATGTARLSPSTVCALYVPPMAWASRHTLEPPAYGNLFTDMHLAYIKCIMHDAWLHVAHVYCQLAELGQVLLL